MKTYLKCEYFPRRTFQREFYPFLLNPLLDLMKENMLRLRNVEVEFDKEVIFMFWKSLLLDNSSPRPPDSIQANSNAIESLPPSHIPVADNDLLYGGD
ncbi:hypothetical protein Tco_0445702 [Tanacetum coccineum]